MSKEASSNQIKPEESTIDEFQDPMSGYATADALAPKKTSDQDKEQSERLRDPMSGYTGADAIPSSPGGQVGVDKVHREQTKDSTSGYASADALEGNEE